MPERRRGAVRSEAARTAILEATARLFAERGYDQLSMEGIAAEARVGKQTIYRWWPSKGALIADCLLEGLLLGDEFETRNTGDLRADLIVWLDTIFGFLMHPRGEVLLHSLIAAAADNAEVGHRLYEDLGAMSALFARLEQGVADGELREGAPLREMGEALV